MVKDVRSARGSDRKMTDEFESEIMALRSKRLTPKQIARKLGTNKPVQIETVLL